MYRAFKIEVDTDLKVMLNQIGKSVSRLDKILTDMPSVDFRFQAKESMKPKLLKMIRNSSLTTKVLNAASIWDEWFPEVKADVFISHSSKDSSLAKSFADWLKQKHQLTAFIDSEIWGHSDELLKELDNEYCLNHGGGTYSYEKRNGSTAHVHMMLSSALARMIDRTECFIFLESHNSVTAEESVNGTYSPWIFHELATVDIIKQKPPTRIIPKVASQRHGIITESFSLKIKYPLIGKRMTEIDSSDLSSWTTYSQQSQAHSLDILYQGAQIQEGGQ
jgi:hypothetical protein